MIALAPVLAMLIGGLIYALTDGKLSECGRLTFGAGVLVLVFQYAGHTVSVLR